jgi:hypothetical protein
MEPDHIDGYAASLEQFARLLPIRFWEYVARIDLAPLEKASQGLLEPFLAL